MRERILHKLLSTSFHIESPNMDANNASLYSLDTYFANEKDSDTLRTWLIKSRVMRESAEFQAGLYINVVMVLMIGIATVAITAIAARSPQNTLVAYDSIVALVVIACLLAVFVGFYQSMKKTVLDLIHEVIRRRVERTALSPQQMHRRKRRAARN